MLENALLLYGITLPDIAYATFHIGQFSIGRVFGESCQRRYNLYLDGIIIFLKTGFFTWDKLHKNKLYGVEFSKLLYLNALSWT